ncbi:MAG: maltose/moltooligosaccharide transporter [Frankiaceae bacterium]|nr:maltose/moltooligosaccharide transporter [Frankiaceae bacterium]
MRRLLITLGLPTLGLAFGLSILTTYGPVVLLRVAHSPARVGALIGGEGAFALTVPLFAGAMSDRLSPSPLGRRLPFVLAGLPLVTTGLLLLPWATSYLVAGVAVLLFFVGYYLYYPPYRAMYADVLPRRLYARAQASQAVLRGVGLGAALMTGGLFLGVWTPLPFVIAAGVLLVTTIPLKRVAQLQGTFSVAGAVAMPASVRDLFHNRDMMTFAVANSMWEFSFAGLRTFIVLYVVRGLDQSPSIASAVIAVVAAAYVAGAPIASRLADRFGLVPVMTWSAIAFGVGLCYGSIPTTLTPLLVALPFVALAGSILLTLPQALAFTLAPVGGQGAAAGLVDFSRGVGVVLGPVAVGVAVSLSASFLSATSGYAAMWPVIGVVMLLSVPILRRLDPAVRQGSDVSSSAAGLRAPV